MRRWLAGAAAIAAVAGAAIALRPHVRPPFVADAGTASFHPRFELGRAITYELDWDTKGFVDGNPVPSSLERGEMPGPRASDLALRSAVQATVTTVVVRSGPDDADLLFQPNELTVLLALGEHVLPGAERVTRQLAAGFVVRTGNDGRIREITLPDDSDPMVRTFASSVAGFLVILGGDLPAETEETDVLGHFRARYALAPEHSAFPDGLAVDKRILGRTPPKQDIHPRDRIGASIRSGSTTKVHFDLVPALGVVREAEGSIANETWLGGKLITKDASTFTLRAVANRLAGTDELPAFADAARSFHAGAPIDQNPEQAQKHDAEEHAIAEGASVPELVAALGTPRLKNEDYGRILRTLIALFRTDPKAITAARAVLLGPPLEPDTFMAIASALAQSDVDAATPALLDVLRAKTSPDPARRGTILELSAIPRPSAAVTGALLEVAEHDADPSLRDTALLVWGVTLGRAAITDPARTAAGTARTGAQLGAAGATEERRVFALRVLGNIGTPAVADLALPLVHEPEVPVRQAALDALRFVEGDASRSALFAGVHDASPEIRELCIFDLEYRPPSMELLQLLEETARADTEESVRAVATAAILRLRGTFPPAYAAIERLRATAPPDVVAQLPKT